MYMYSTNYLFFSQIFDFYSICVGYCGNLVSKNTADRFS